MTTDYIPPKEPHYTTRVVNGVAFAYGNGCEYYSDCLSFIFPDCKWQCKGSAVPEVKHEKA